MANAGRVELDLVAVGKDQVSAMLRQVDQQLRKTAGEMKATGQATGDVGAQLDGLKTKASGVNKVREVFENLRSNTFFVVGAVTGLVSIVVDAVGAIGELVSGADRAAKAMAYWEAQQQETNDAIKKGWEALDKFKSSPMESALSDINVQLAKASQVMADLKDDEDERRKVLGDIRKLREVQAAIESDIARDQERQADAWDRIERRMREASIINVPLLSPFIGNADDLALERNFAGEPETPEQKAAREKRLAAAIARSRGGGRRKVDKFAIPASITARILPSGPGLFNTDDMSILDAVLGNARDTEGSQQRAALAEMRSDAEKLAAALQQVADATGLVAQAMPEMGSALAEVQAITAQVVEGKMSLNNALAAGATAIAANAAKAIGGVRAEAAVRAAYEVGMGFATIANPIVSAGHFTAAALLGAVAAGAGGGGGGARAGGSSRGESRGGGSDGPSTIVYNFSTLVTDRQQVVSAVRQSQRSTRGTGLDTRAGV